MNGISNNTPRKRRLSEYRDPDYLEKLPAKKQATLSQSLIQGSNTVNSATDTHTNAFNGDRLQKVHEIITREFQIEISHQKQQLKEIDQSIEDANKIFNKLRYKIVADYYKKQEIPINNVEAAQLRGENTLFADEEKGAQLPLHGSLKKILGKKPVTLAEILRINPKRAAAKQAQFKIDEVTQASNKSQQRREERRVQKLIREQGIVIDHSKNDSFQANKLQDQEQAQLLSQMVQREQEEKPCTSKTALNAARLNNKVNHLIVVGNTSKYIGEDNKQAHSNGSVAGQRFTHKWLIYVHAKDSSITPLERIIKKIRFYLHESYKPHDIVEIKSPPFQLSRRGWGEFPVRLQLFFFEELQQKPVQLLHHLVLDKTLSGLQTMGSETLVEVWLRPLTTISSINLNKTESSDDDNEEPAVQFTDDYYNDNNERQKTRTFSLGQLKDEDLNDDHLFEFLNRIEGTPNMLFVDDIDQIEPTVVVNENTLVSPIELSPKKSMANKSTFSNNLDNIVTTTTNHFTTDALKFTNKEIFPEIITPNNICPTTTMTTTDNICPTTTITTMTTTNNICPPTTTITTVATIPVLQNINTINNNEPKPTTSIVKTMIVTTVPSTTLTTTTTTTTAAAQRLNTLKFYPQATKPAVICLKQLIDKNTNNSIPATTTTTTTTTVLKNIATNASRAIALPKTTKLVPILNKPNIQNKAVGTTTIPNILGVDGKRLEKKLVKFVDAEGKVKYVQMLVATTNKIDTKSTTTTTTSTTPITTNNKFTVSNGGILIANIPKQNNKNVPGITKVAPPILTMSAPNVFQKEGKLYLRDPLQMKLKQQQQKQQSLLKPQVSLLKQQQNLQQQLVQQQQHENVKTIDRCPNIHLGIRETRELNLDINKQKSEQNVREKLFDCFRRAHFQSIVSAIEFLLRRLPLVTNKTNKHLYAFSFIFCGNLSEFKQLPALKQRSLEWLRAKLINEKVREHKQLHELVASSVEGNELYWTTREIVLWARFHAYTPPLKSLNTLGRIVEKKQTEEESFQTKLREELKTEQANIEFNTLTSIQPIYDWLEKMDKEEPLPESDDELEVDVLGIEDVASKSNAVEVDNVKSDIFKKDCLLLPVPENLENSALLAQDMCRDLRYKLTPAEQIVEGVQQPMASIVLAQCLHMFVEKLVRRSIAVQAMQTKNTEMLTEPSISLQDLGKVITSADNTDEYDFLTNMYMGKPIVKEEELEDDCA